MPDAKEFLQTPASAQWKRLGTQRRAGVALPLFFVQSKKSVGVGELPDLELLADWCIQTGQSLIQLLPMNDTGFDFRPYDSQSSFALEPMYLSLEKLAYVPPKEFSSDIDFLRKRFPLDSPWFDTSVKREKLKILKKMFLRRDLSGDKDFKKYRERERSWLESYVLFKVIKAKMNGLAWEAWPDALRNREEDALTGIRRDESEALEFEAWLQWQLYRQFREVAGALQKKGVRLIGDLPFLVSRDSADVWSERHYFKLHLSSGAPPDLYFADGQQWGMPPYHWQALEAGGYDYFAEKLRYAENFYDLFRIDHFVGIFRVWTFPREGAREGAFDPSDESLWEPQGRKVVQMMLSKTRMLPCAEDLGTVPDCSFRVLKESGIPGMEIQRWMRDWGHSWDFKPGMQYRVNSIVTLSTHDMVPFEAWWEFEAGRVDEKMFEKKCRAHGIEYSAVAERLFDLKKRIAGRVPWKKEINSVKAFIDILGKEEHDVRDLVDLYLSTSDEKERFWKSIGLHGNSEESSSQPLVYQALETAGKASSVFCVHPLQDWLALGKILGAPSLDRRINEPGTVNETNWRFRMSVYLEDLKKLPINKTIKAINKKTERV